MILALPPMTLESIHVPTLVIHGTSDNIVDYAVAVDSAQRISNAQFISIDKGTHLMLATHSDEISMVIKNFIG
jgi:non-heme chloroperoxidase